ncbi:MAG: maleylacetoacetate isomerase [Gammaproteobacteria bacterium]
MILHDFWRSSAAYRVRIALNLKGIAVTHTSHSLSKGAHRSAEFLRVNPQGLVPVLQAGDDVVTQSIAIIEYLDETHPEQPLLPSSPAERATVRAMALSVACDIHPLNNLRVVNYLRSEFKADEEAVTRWIRHWIGIGFEALELQAKRWSADGRYCFGSRATLADACLIPQMYNARRFGCDLSPYPTLVGIDTHCRALEPFLKAAPEAQPDAV